MQAGLTPELDGLKNMVRQIVRDECVPLEADYLANPPQEGVDDGGPKGIAETVMGIVGTLDHEKWGRLNRISKDTGIYTSFVPEEYGGGGMGALGHVVMDEEIHKSIVQLPTSPVPMMMIGSCTAEQEERYLYPAIQGDLNYAFGQTEPQAGSDPGGMMQTRAVRDGDDWVITGTKMFISGAANADFLLVQAVTDQEKRQRGGITMFIVDNPTPGLSFDPIRVWIVPTRAQQYMVNLDEVRVPQTQVLGEVGMGFTLGQKWLVHHDRLLRGSMALGILTRALEMAIEWAKQRVTYGRPISDRQAIQWMLADSATELAAARMLVLRAASAAEQQERVTLEAAMAKLSASEAAHRAADRAMQVLASAGYTRGSTVDRLYRDARATEIYQGTSEVQRMIIAEQVIGPAEP